MEYRILSNVASTSLLEECLEPGLMPGMVSFWTVAGQDTASHFMKAGALWCRVGSEYSSTNIGSKQLEKCTRIIR